ncbi:retinoic acid receptor RXR [Caerostris extrusa]|uniref:Retinoic acid receptor RXR n=1 Tax=Caerostris extrusa TaxID=172846 RepID=A0AAV4N836_CAEEX|nr:retinoic acid receptor RXR [Caerostris extrusa]
MVLLYHHPLYPAVLLMQHFQPFMEQVIHNCHHPRIPHLHNIHPIILCVILNICVLSVVIELLESIMVFTVVKDVKVFSSVLFEKTSHMPVERNATASLIRDKRNRCQYCRYQKCLSMGMKREAVQEERQRNREKNENEVESTSSNQPDISIERILEAEFYMDNTKNEDSGFCEAWDQKQLQVVRWAKHIPHFVNLSLDDRHTILKAGWNEILIASFCHSSTELKEGIKFAHGYVVHRTSALTEGVVSIYDQARNLKAVQDVSNLRDKVYTVLEEYCRQKYPSEGGRFAKLLLRLPALRSMGLKCYEHLFFKKSLWGSQTSSFRPIPSTNSS